MITKLHTCLLVVLLVRLLPFLNQGVRVDFLDDLLLATIWRSTPRSAGGQVLLDLQATFTPLSLAVQLRNTLTLVSLLEDLELISFECVLLSVGEDVPGVNVLDALVLLAFGFRPQQVAAAALGLIDNQFLFLFDPVHQPPLACSEGLLFFRSFPWIGFAFFGLRSHLALLGQGQTPTTRFPLGDTLLAVTLHK